MRFSQRKGLTPATKVVQRESIDDDLRASLWNLLTLFYWNGFLGRDEYTSRSNEVSGSNLEQLMCSLWINYFKQPIDTIERYWESCLHRLRGYFFGAQWHQVYDFIEFIAHNGNASSRDGFIEACNKHLERENSAYRFVNGQITEITSQQEIEEIESAIQQSDSFSGVSTHLTAALALMSSKTSPDYRNSIKESISAVESLALQMAKDNSGTLGAVLRRLEISKKLHPALRNAFSSLYGYTSDANGIRHALLEEPNLSKADARFMLVCCSAFINYAIVTLEAT